MVNICYSLGMSEKFTPKTQIIVACLVLVLGVAIIVALMHKSTPVASPSSTPSQQVATSNDDDASITESSPTSPLPVTSSGNSACHARGSLPDSNCTPGATDPRVTQDNIHQTICVSGYSKSVRPSSSITSSMKKISMQQYGFTDSSSNYEYDHLISLELGGAPADTKNLWPEPGGSPNPKDKVENKLHSLVCAGSMALAEAQRRIATDWTTALSGY